MLRKTSEYFSVTADDDEVDDEDDGDGGVVVRDPWGRTLRLDGAFFIGADVLGFIRRYLAYKDGTLAGLPRCLPLALPPALGPSSC
jgi:hypothetical protein